MDNELKACERDGDGSVTFHSALQPFHQQAQQQLQQLQEHTSEVQGHFKAFASSYAEQANKELIFTLANFLLSLQKAHKDVQREAEIAAKKAKQEQAMAPPPTAPAAPVAPAAPEVPQGPSKEQL